MFCELHPTGEVRGTRFGFICPHCGRPYWSNYSGAEKIKGRICDADGPAPREPSLANAGDCVHRGNLLRSELCPTCSGTVKVKVFACALHGECEMANKLKEVKRCGSCTDFAPIEP